MDTLGDHMLKMIIDDFDKYKAKAERAFEQLTDDDFHQQAGKDQNSIAIIIQHMAGNLRSRWTEFLTSDGEKADRHRDQ